MVQGIQIWEKVDETVTTYKALLWNLTEKMFQVANVAVVFIFEIEARSIPMLKKKRIYVRSF